MKLLGRVVNSMGLMEFSLPTLESKQAFVGGRVEATDLPNGITIWSNEESFPHNDTLNVIIHDQTGEKHHFFGNVYFSNTGDDGKTAPLTKEQLDYLIKITAYGYLEVNRHGVMIIELRLGVKQF